MKRPSYPIIIDDCLRFSVGDLKRLGFFAPGVAITRLLCWGEDKSITASVDADNRFVSLTYTFNGEEKRYDVGIVQRDANIGRGVVRFFTCPATHTLCSKLYFVGGWFVSRRAIHGAMYRTQTKSKLWRLMPDGFLRDDFIPYRRHGKPYYRGKLTPYGKRIQRYIAREDLAMCAWLYWLDVPYF